MKRLCLKLSALSLLMPLAAPVQSDVLLIDSVQDAPGVQAPRGGLTMSEVRQQFGNPVTEYPTVSVNGGPHQPPITRWDYNGYSVVFEHDRVVHSVIHRPSVQ